MSDSVKQPAWLRIGRWILLGLFGLILQVLVVWLILDATSKSSLHRYERQWEIKGEHFAFADFVPKPIPNDRNFALTPIMVTSYGWVLDTNGHKIIPKKANYVNRLEMKIYGDARQVAAPTNAGNWVLGSKIDLKALQLYYRALAATTDEFSIPSQPQSPAADVLLALSRYDTAIEELRQAAALPDSRFPLNYDNDPPADILLPHLAGLKRCSEMLQLRAVAELQNGQSDKALADVKLILRLMDAVRNEPFLISPLVRILMLKLALQPVWEGIQDHRWSDTQLAELDQALAKLDFLVDYEFSVRSEQALAMADFDYMRRTRNLVLFFGSDGKVIPVVTEVELRFFPSSAFYENELALARAEQQWLLPIIDVEQHSVSLEAARLAEINIKQERGHWSLNNVLACLRLPGMAKCCQKFAYAQSVADMARVACALERFRLAHGEYPEMLDAVSPRFMESVPPDVISGQPPKYHRTGDGQFVLYSVGWNGTDDGGAVFMEDHSKTYIDYDKGDWVWTGQVMNSK